MASSYDCLRSNEVTFQAIRKRAELRERRLASLDDTFGSTERESRLRLEDSKSSNRLFAPLLDARTSTDRYLQEMRKVSNPNGESVTPSAAVETGEDSVAQAQRELAQARARRARAMHDRLERNVIALKQMEADRDRAILKARKEAAEKHADACFARFGHRRAFRQWRRITRERGHQQMAITRSRYHKMRVSWLLLSRRLQQQRSYRLHGLVHLLRSMSTRLLAAIAEHRNRSLALRAMLYKAERHYWRRLVLSTLRTWRIISPFHRAQRCKLASRRYLQTAGKCALASMRERCYSVRWQRQKENNGVRHEFIRLEQAMQVALRCFVVQVREHTAKRSAVDHHIRFQLSSTVRKWSAFLRERQFQRNSHDAVALFHDRIVSLRKALREWQQIRTRRQRFLLRQKARSTRRMIFFQNKPQSVLTNSFGDWRKRSHSLRMSFNRLCHVIENHRRVFGPLSLVISMLRTSISKETEVRRSSPRPRRVEGQEFGEQFGSSLWIDTSQQQSEGLSAAPRSLSPLRVSALTRRAQDFSDIERSSCLHSAKFDLRLKEIMTLLSLWVHFQRFRKRLNRNRGKRHQYRCLVDRMMLGKNVRQIQGTDKRLRGAKKKVARPVTLSLLSAELESRIGLYVTARHTRWLKTSFRLWLSKSQRAYQLSDRVYNYRLCKSTNRLVASWKGWRHRAQLIASYDRARVLCKHLYARRLVSVLYKKSMRRRELRRKREGNLWRIRDKAILVIRKWAEICRAKHQRRRLRHSAREHWLRKRGKVLLLDWMNFVFDRMNLEKLRAKARLHLRTRQACSVFSQWRRATAHFLKERQQQQSLTATRATKNGVASKLSAAALKSAAAMRLMVFRRKAPVVSMKKLLVKWLTMIHDTAPARRQHMKSMRTFHEHTLIKRLFRQWRLRMDSVVDSENLIGLHRMSFQLPFYMRKGMRLWRLFVSKCHTQSELFRMGELHFLHLIARRLLLDWKASSSRRRAQLDAVHWAETRYFSMRLKRTSLKRWRLNAGNWFKRRNQLLELGQGTFLRKGFASWKAVARQILSQKRLSDKVTHSMLAKLMKSRTARSFKFWLLLTRHLRKRKLLQSRAQKQYRRVLLKRVFTKGLKFFVDESLSLSENCLVRANQCFARQLSRAYWRTWKYRHGVHVYQQQRVRQHQVDHILKSALMTQWHRYFHSQISRRNKRNKTIAMAFSKRFRQQKMLRLWRAVSKNRVLSLQRVCKHAVFATQLQSVGNTGVLDVKATKKVDQKLMKMSDVLREKTLLDLAVYSALKKFMFVCLKASPQQQLLQLSSSTSGKYERLRPGEGNKIVDTANGAIVANVSYATRGVQKLFSTKVKLRRLFHNWKCENELVWQPMKKRILATMQSRRLLSLRHCTIRWKKYCEFIQREVLPARRFAQSVYHNHMLRTSLSQWLAIASQSIQQKWQNKMFRFQQVHFFIWKWKFRTKSRVSVPNQFCESVIALGQMLHFHGRQRNTYQASSDCDDFMIVMQSLQRMWSQTVSAGSSILLKRSKQQSQQTEPMDQVPLRVFSRKTQSQSQLLAADYHAELSIKSSFKKWREHAKASKARDAFVKNANLVRHFRMCLRALRRRVAPSSLSRKRHTSLITVADHRKLRKAIRRWRVTLLKERLRSRRARKQLLLRWQQWQWLFRKMRRKKKVLMALVLRKQSRELQFVFNDWQRDTIIERRVANALCWRKKKALLVSLRKWFHKSKAHQRRRNRVKLHLQHFIFRYRKPVANAKERDTPKAVMIRWTFPPLYYHSAVRFIRSLLHDLGRRYMARSQLEKAALYHSREQKRSVLSNLFHLRRNRIASDHLLKRSLRLLCKRLAFLHRDRKRAKRDLTCALRLNVSFALRQWRRDVRFRQARRQQKALLKHREPFRVSVDCGEYYETQRMRSVLFRLLSLRHDRFSVSRYYAQCDEWHDKMKISKAFAHFKRFTTLKLLRRRNAAVLSLMEERQQVRRALNLWSCVVVNKFLKYQKLRLTKPSILERSPMGGFAVADSHQEVTIRFDRNVKRAFAHMWMLVRSKKNRQRQKLLALAAEKAMAVGDSVIEMPRAEESNRDNNRSLKRLGRIAFSLPPPQ